MPILSALLKRIKVVESDNREICWWPSHIQSGEVPPIDFAIVAGIKAKGKLAELYDWHGAEEKWLLLVAEAHGLTDIIGGARPIALPELSTFPFNLVVLWDRFSEDIWTVFPDYAILCHAERQTRYTNLLPSRLQFFVTGGAY